MHTYLTMLPVAVIPEFDDHGRQFITHHERRYLVPACAGEMNEPCGYWNFHDHLRLAYPAAKGETTPFTCFAGPRDYEAGESIHTIDCESRAVAWFVAACHGMRFFGWDITNHDGRDCTGQTFASGSTIFRMERLSREPRSHFARYGFHTSWCRDI